MNKERVFFVKENSSILAIFPDQKERNSLYGCYAHIGQHSSAHKDYLKEHNTIATKKEYIGLYNELTKIVGYNLQVMQKATILDWIKRI